jgi:hypothetical protein
MQEWEVIVFAMVRASWKLEAGSKEVGSLGAEASNRET